MVRRLTRLGSLLVALVAVAPGSAHAAPRVGLVVVAHEGLTDAQSDELGYDLAAAVAARIEGEAVAGSTVKTALDGAGGIPAGCGARPDCARGLAATLKADEVLMLVFKKVKKDVEVNARRIARDESLAITDGQARIPGSKAKRDKAVEDLAAQLFAPGSVVPYVAPPPQPVVQAPPPPPPPAPSVTRQKWFWPVIAVAGVVVIGGAVTAGVLLGQPSPTGAPIALP